MAPVAAGRTAALDGSTGRGHSGRVEQDRGAGVEVRAGRADDLPALVPLAGTPDRAWWRVDAAGAGRDALLVAERAGETLGVVSLRWVCDCDPPHPWLYGLHVRHDARRAGIGTLLVRAAHAAATDRGARAVSLDVDRAEPGLVRWYEALGYRRVGPHDHRWTAVDPVTGRVTASGTSPTWLLRHPLPPTAST